MVLRALAVRRVLKLNQAVIISMYPLLAHGRIADYPNLTGLLRDIYQMPNVAQTVHMDHIRHHYFRSHPTLNPQGIISIGPKEDFSAAHNRERLGERIIRKT